MTTTSDEATADAARQERFDALGTEQRASLATELFAILNADLADGWNADHWMWIGRKFHDYGVTFP